jgi:hypothetical protein
VSSAKKKSIAGAQGERGEHEEHAGPEERVAVVAADLEQERATDAGRRSDDAAAPLGGAERVPDEAQANDGERRRHDEAGPPVGDAARQRLAGADVGFDDDPAGVGQHHRRHRRDGAAEITGHATEEVAFAQERRGGQAEVLARRRRRERAEEAEPDAEPLLVGVGAGHALAADLAQQHLDDGKDHHRQRNDDNQHALDEERVLGRRMWIARALPGGGIEVDHLRWSTLSCDASF